MKKILYILSIALLAALSCNKEFDRPMHRTQDKTPEGSMLLTFSVPMSPSTKDAMNDKPNITPTSKMYVLVFNASSRTLLQVSPAVLKGSINENTPWDADDENDIYNADFAAEVGMGSAPRYLQFVVDAPDHTPASGNDNETMIGTADLPGRESLHQQRSNSMLAKDLSAARPPGLHLPRWQAQIWNGRN